MWLDRFFGLTILLIIFFSWSGYFIAGLVGIIWGVAIVASIVSTIGGIFLLKTKE